MQRVIAVKWTLDNKYVLSASEEMNIRLWKANASEKLGVVRGRHLSAPPCKTARSRRASHYPLADFFIVFFAFADGHSDRRTGSGRDVGCQSGVSCRAP